MSGLVSGITKVFSSIGTGVAKLGSAVRGVGASLFTAGAAKGASVAGQGGLFGSGGILSNMFNGVGRVLGLSGPGGSIVAAGASPAAAATGAVDNIVTGAVGTATGYGTDAWSKALTPGLQTAATPTGLASTGASAATQQGGGGLLRGFGNFLGSEGGAALIGGIGSALGTEREAELEEESRERDRQYLREAEQRVTDSYNVPMSVFAGSEKNGAWKYNPNTGQIERT